MKSIIIVGGGNAAYISALILKTRFSDLKITIIKSEKIGTIGVGEGSTEQWSVFCDFVGINYLDLLKECSATFKYGVHFKNWTKNDYYHSISPPISVPYGDCLAYCGYFISKNYLQKNTIQKVFRDNKIPLNFSQPTAQFHFDSNKLNSFLMTKCKNKGIIVKNDEIVDVSLKENGCIGSVLSENNKYVADFFIDCSGFKRILINKSLGVEWISYSDKLLMNNAITWQEKNEGDISNYTLCHAKNNGWMWRIPTQEKNAYGYIFCDRFCSIEDAKKEVGVVEIDKHIKFDPGKLEKFIHKNCLAVGLSSSFLEPMEATSIGFTIQQIFCFMHFAPSKDYFSANKHMDMIFENMFNFVLLHYNISREDTDFWKYNKENYKNTKILNEISEIFEKRLPLINEIGKPWTLFGSLNFIQIFHGLNLLNNENIKREYEFLDKKMKKIIHENVYDYNHQSFDSVNQRFIIDKLKI